MLQPAEGTGDEPQQLVLPDVYANRLVCNSDTLRASGIAYPNCNRVSCANPGEIGKTSPRGQCILYAHSECVPVACSGKGNSLRWGTSGRHHHRDADGKRL